MCWISGVLALLIEAPTTRFGLGSQIGWIDDSTGGSTSFQPTRASAMSFVLYKFFSSRNPPPPGTRPLPPDPTTEADRATRVREAHGQGPRSYTARLFPPSPEQAGFSASQKFPPPLA